MLHWKQAFRKPMLLFQFLELDMHHCPWELDFRPRFPFLVTVDFAKRMRKGDWNDPLLKQVLPLKEETKPVQGFTQDAVGDLDASPIHGMINKYQKRILVMPTSACAIHCRYCFRKEFPYSSLPKQKNAWEKLWQNPQLNDAKEIILSGGDPLCLDDEKLGEIISKISSLKKKPIIRIHSRLPIVIPKRITNEFLKLMDSENQIVIVIHANHPHEISLDCKKALKKLAHCATVLNQSVLLKGINDDPEILSQLSMKLLQAGVVPYYLHQLDRVKGTHHFEVTKQKGLFIMDTLRNCLPGYAVPRYVEEIPGDNCKRPIFQ